MKYGIYSEMDNETTRAIFKNKRIPEKNMFHINNLSELLRRVGNNDTVVVISITRFRSILQFGRFARYCRENGVALNAIEEPYLDIGNGRVWKNSVENQLINVAEVEIQLKRHLGNAMRLNNPQWQVIHRGIEMQNLAMVSKIYSADGVMKRGS